MRPRLAVHHNGVGLIGESLGETEAEIGYPFEGKAGFKLTRLIEWAGFNREQFDIFNAVWCRPPDNKLDGEIYESGAISHCRSAHWSSLLGRSRVLVPLGNVPMRAILGRTGITKDRGYIWSADSGHHVIPTVHPSYIQRGQSRWSAPFIHDIQKAVKVAAEGVPPQLTTYRLDPLPYEALCWARDYLTALRDDPSIYLAFDIETPGKDDDEDEIDTDTDAPDRTWRIDRVGFSYRGLSALSVPWEPAYFAAIRLLLESAGPKVVWNQGFDVPRIRRAGFGIDGIIHDGMVAWHVLHSDLPKSLRFVATFTCPFQPAWKHLSSARPAFYNATDADVELRSMIHIEQSLRDAGLWDVYVRDVVELEPILIHMHQKGMPVDAEVRLDRARKLAEQFALVRSQLEDAVPREARRIDHVYKETPKDVTGLLSRPGTRLVRRCSVCGLAKPRRDHTKRFVKKANPCADAPINEVEESVSEFYRLSPFSPSRDQLIRYHQHLGRPLPTVWDKKAHKRRVSFGERQILDLRGKYPLDPIYGLVIEYRTIDKIAGTYIGRPNDASL